MRHTFLFVAMGLALLGARTTLAQTDRGAGAYPMNVMDRIAEAGNRGIQSGAPADSVIITTYGDDEKIGRAGAFPMNTMDRIKMTEMNATRRWYSPAPAVRSQVSPAAASRPDGWRYQRFQNRWWYYSPAGQWSYWRGNRWNKFVAPPPAAE